MVLSLVHVHALYCLSIEMAEAGKRQDRDSGASTSRLLPFHGGSWRVSLGAKSIDL